MRLTEIGYGTQSKRAESKAEADDTVYIRLLQETLSILNKLRLKENHGTH
jgi:hypothetical protein